MKYKNCIILLMLLTTLLAGAQPLGDVNIDNRVDVVDALLVAQYYINILDDVSGNIETYGDVNLDSIINIIDALFIAQFYIGILDTLPPGATPEPTPEVTPENTPEATHNIKLTFSFVFGRELEPIIYKNIYAVWIADMEGACIQNLNICRYLIDTTGKDTDIALPYWRQNALIITPQEEIDAVTSATHQSEDFTIEALYSEPEIRQFMIYFEMDRYREKNDWFTDQPAVLYAAEVDLDHPEETYNLEPIGWTTNSFNTRIIDNPPQGEFQSDMRYITQHSDGTAFGEADERAATTMVKSISLTVSKD